MHKIVISPGVRSSIRKYIDAYALYYENLYTDSGLGIAETIIIEQYLQSAQSISDNIYDAIEQSLSVPVILGYSETIEHSRTITTRIEHRRLFLTYTETSDERRVTDIRIVRL